MKRTKQRSCQKLQALIAFYTVDNESQYLNELFAKKEAIGMSRNQVLRRTPCITFCKN